MWQKQPTDRCEHCKEVLDPISLKVVEERSEQERIQKENDFFRIRDSDGYH